MNIIINHDYRPDMTQDLPLEALAVLWYIFRRKGRPGAPDKKKDRADGTDGE